MRLFKSIGLVMAIVFAALYGDAQTLELGNDTAVCNNYPFVLDAGPGFIDYQWSTGFSGQSIVVNGSGTYAVTVTDVNNLVQIDSINVTLYVSPTAVFLGSNVCFGLPTQFTNLSRTQDTVANWLWDFGDGVTDTSFEPTHTFATYGIHYITLHVTSIHGCSDSVMNPVQVFGLPFVDGGSNDSINIGTTTQLHGTTAAQFFQWLPQDNIADTTVKDPIASPQFTTLYSFVATDSLGCSNSDTVLVYVNQFPIAVNDNVVIGTGTGAIINVQNNDNDPNGDVLTTTIVTAPANGTASVLNNDSIQYTPNAKFSGTDTIIYKVCDGFSTPLCATAIVIVSVSNVPPIAQDDTITTTVNTTGVTNVLANDRDRNDEPLSIGEISSPSHGLVTDLGNGLLSYTPAERYIGLDTFYYIICNNGAPVLCDTAYVFVEVLHQDLKISNSFSPNGDGVVDNFVIEGISLFPNNHLLVFSRWGDKIYEQDHYNNEWNGSRGGDDTAPDGIYFYQLSLGDGSKDITGWIVLKR